MTLDREPATDLSCLQRDNGLIHEAVIAKPPPLEQWVAKRVKVTLNQFSSFAAVAKHLSVSKASAELRVSQPSISFQLKQLEDHHGQKLYRRTSKGVEITDAGQSFLRKIGPILEQVAELEREFRQPDSKSPRAALIVGGTFSASAVLLPRLLARFRALHPHAEMEFQTNTSEKLERLVARDAMQLAVTDRRPVVQGLDCESLRAEKVLVFARPDHPLAQGTSVDLSEVLSEPLIVRGGKGISGATQNALKKLKEQGRTVRIGMVCDGPAAIKAAVRQNMGIGIAFTDSIKLEIEAGEFRVLKVKDFEIQAESFVVYANNRSLPALAREFLELLREVQRKEKFASPSSVTRGSNRLGKETVPAAAAAE